jgi:hypothetical protein
VAFVPLYPFISQYRKFDVKMAKRQRGIVIFISQYRKFDVKMAKRQRGIVIFISQY